jgi:hypothetical protein
VRKSKSFNRKLQAGIALGALAIAGALAPRVLADPKPSHGDISHVLLISIDGMHALIT